MSIWHEEIDEWVLTYNRQRGGSKDILSATNLELDVYFSTDEHEGLQDPLETLYRSLDYPSEKDMPEKDDMETRDLTQHGLETLEGNIREAAAEEMLADGRGPSNSRDWSEEAAEKRMSAYDHEWNPMG